MGCGPHPGLHQALEIHATKLGSDRVFTIQPGGLTAEPVVGQGKGADHRSITHLTLHLAWVPELWPTGLWSDREKDWLCLRTHAAGIPPGCHPLRSACPVVVSPAAPKRPPATLCQPSGLGWPAEREANISRTAALARANLSLMQPGAAPYGPGQSFPLKGSAIAWFVSVHIRSWLWRGSEQRHGPGFRSVMPPSNGAPVF